MLKTSFLRGCQTIRRFRLSLLIVIFLSLALLYPRPSSSSDCSARCWYVKYKQEQLRSARLARRVSGLQRALSGRSVLTRHSAPWIALAGCESGSQWAYNGRSGFDGGLQFDPGTWTNYGGGTFSRYAWQATPHQQVAIAQKVLARQGRMAWPGCTNKGAW